MGNNIESEKNIGRESWGREKERGERKEREKT